MDNVAAMNGSTNRVELIQARIQALCQADKILDSQLKILGGQRDAIGTQIDDVEAVLSRRVEELFGRMGKATSDRAPAVLEGPRIVAGSGSEREEVAPSHARLLSLISQRSDIELQMQFIESQKIALANIVGNLYELGATLDPEESSHGSLTADKKAEIAAWVQDQLQADMVESSNSHAASQIDQSLLTQQEKKGIVRRKQSTSELSNISDTSSLPSLMGSDFSGLTGSSVSSVVSLDDAGKQLNTLLLGDSNSILPLYREGLRQLGADSFERSIRRLLKLFGVDLHKEAITFQQANAGKFVLYQARSSAHFIKTTCIQQENLVFEEPVFFGERASDESEGSDSDYETYQDEPADLQGLRNFIMRSKAFNNFKARLRSLIDSTKSTYPNGKQRLQVVLELF
jgi:hypothetical protein